MEDKISHTWVDPRQYKGTDDLSYNYMIAWALAQAAEEILSWIEDATTAAEQLSKKERGELQDKYAIGKSNITSLHK